VKFWGRMRTVRVTGAARLPATSTALTRVVSFATRPTRLSRRAIACVGYTERRTVAPGAAAATAVAMVTDLRRFVSPRRRDVEASSASSAVIVHVSEQRNDCERWVPVDGARQTALHRSARWALAGVALNQGRPQEASRAAAEDATLARQADDSPARAGIGVASRCGLDAQAGAFEGRACSGSLPRAMGNIARMGEFNNKLAYTGDLSRRSCGRSPAGRRGASSGETAGTEESWAWGNRGLATLFRDDFQSWRRRARRPAARRRHHRRARVALL
jgi:hypothetical protein